MTTFEKRMLLAAIVALGLLVVMQLVLPKPVDWTESFEADDTRPYGSRVLFETLDAVAPRADVEAVSVSPFLKLRELQEGTGTAYVFVAEDFEPDPQETAMLLEYAARGNTVWIAAEDVSGPLADTLGITMRSLGYFGLARADTAAYDTLRFVGLSPDVRTRPTRKNTVQYAFEDVDSTRVRPLAVWARGSETDGGAAGRFFRDDHRETPPTVMVGSTAGEGQIFIASFPQALTNINLVDSLSAPSAYAALSYIPANTRVVYWDRRHKPLVTEARTPLRFLINTPTLRTALYLGLLGLTFLFVIGVRRRQRPIPVVEPPRNETLDFVRTVGDLYYREGDNAEMAQRKIRYFRTHLRTMLGLSPTNLDASDGTGNTSDLAGSIARRSGVPRDTVDDLLRRMKHAQGRSSMKDEELKALANAINAFNRMSER